MLRYMAVCTLDVCILDDGACVAMGRRPVVHGTRQKQTGAVTRNARIATAGVRHDR